MDIERYKQEQSLAPDQTALDAAYQNIKDSFENRVNFPNIFDGIGLFDRMGRATLPGTKRAFEAFGRDPQISQSLFDEIDTARTAGDDERAMLLIRVSYLMGHAEDPLLIKAANFIPPLYHPLRRLAEFLGQDSSGSVKMGQYDLWFEDHKQLLEAKRAAAAGARARARTAGTGAGRAPSPDWSPENTVSKSAEWTTTRADIEAKWQTASQLLPTDGSPRSTSTRFEAGFNVIHQEMLRPHGPNGRALQTMIEYLIPHIWIKQDHVERFLKGVKKQDNITSIPDLDEIAKALHIPRNYRTVTGPLNQTQKEALVRIYRRFGFALHEDLTKANPDTNPDLKTHMESLLKAVNVVHESLTELLK